MSFFFVTCITFGILVYHDTAYTASILMILSKVPCHWLLLCFVEAVISITLGNVLRLPWKLVRGSPIIFLHTYPAKHPERLDSREEFQFQSGSKFSGESCWKIGDSNSIG